MPVDNRPTRAHIHLDRLLTNYRHAQSLAPGKTAMAVVKADAYGHGAVLVSRTLQEHGCRWFGVATLAEAAELRGGGITGEILVMGGIYTGDEEEAIRLGVACAVFDVAGAERLDAAARRLNERVPVHLKIETGMARLGFEIEGFSAFVRSLSDYRNLAVRGIFSHLAQADRVDGLFTDEQSALLRSAHQTLLGAVGEVAHLHLANSSALLLKRPMPGDLVRPGIMLYGGYSLDPAHAAVVLEPVMELRSAIAQVRSVRRGRQVSYGGTWTAERDSILGVVPAGYADGVPRLLSNVGEVLVAGHRVQICGRVTMDYVVIDLTDVPAARAGQEVILLGGQGRERISAEDWSRWAQTIPYEIFSGISSRVPRAYIGAGQGGD